jgi:hypothetical protein
MNMFSYDTFANEAKYDALPKNTQNSYTAVKDASIPADAKLTSLTNNPISSDKNFMYGGEVEYILYGGDDSANKVKSYASIFAIRLGFNLIYAFTESEIRDGALAIAAPISAATLGVIPAPLIQAAIIIGISIGESSIDLMYLREGMKVPLFKNRDTWQLSFSNLLEKLGSAAGSLVGDMAEKAIHSTTEYLDAWLDKTDEELEELVSGGTDDLMISVDETFDSLITRQINAVIQKLTTLIENGIEEGEQANIGGYVASRLDAWLQEAAQTESPSSLSYKVKKEAVAVLKESGNDLINTVFEGIRDAAEDATTAAATILNDIISTVRETIARQVRQASEAVLEYKTQMINKVKDSVGKGAEELKKTIREQMNGVFGASDAATDVTGISSLLSFQYSDYLRLFLMIGLFTNEKTILLRTADAIQVNMAKKIAKKEDYQLKKSAVYVRVEAEIQVKPILLALPLFSDVEDNPKDDTKWYTIPYNSVRGY